MLSIEPNKFFYKEKEIEIHTNGLNYQNIHPSIHFTNKSKNL